MQPTKKDLIIFGLIWAFIFSFIAFYPLIQGERLNIWAVIPAFLLIMIIIIAPKLLTKFYYLWLKFGEIIGGIISKIILLVLFFVLFTPIALCLKILKKDLLQQRLDRETTTYWQTREIQPTSLKSQF